MSHCFDPAIAVMEVTICGFCFCFKELSQLVDLGIQSGISLER